MKAAILTPWVTGGTNHPQLGDDHPCSWQDVTGQQTYQLPTLPNAYVVEALGVDETWLDAVAADSTYVILWGAADEEQPSDNLTAPQLTAIRAALSLAGTAQVDHYIGTATDGRTQAEVAADVVEFSSLFLRQDEMSAEAYAALVARYPSWAAGVAYVAGQLFAYGGQLYECVQGHTSQVGWEPPNVPALWTHSVPHGVIPAWVQPLGAHDAYSLGAQVTHGGQVWESTVAANVWEPGVFGWVVV